MPVERYRFHCTDGHDAVIDRSGRAIGRQILVKRHAERVARTMMEASDSRIDWSGWIVDVHDAQGRRALALPFADAAGQSAAVAA